MAAIVKIKDVFCAEYFNEYSKQTHLGRQVKLPFAQIELVHCYPNDLHIADVTLLDLTQT